MVNELVRKVIHIVNHRAINAERPTISPINGSVISNLLDADRDVINFVKQIKGEMPLPHLQEILEKFVSENEKNKKDGKTKVLV